jgi:hypothetical protein
MDIIPDNKLIDFHLFILDPLSVIIKLAILSNKPIGTKLFISNNIVSFQEPGPFQAFCRYWFNTNKTDLQYLYNPIELACSFYLSETMVAKHSKLNDLFKGAQNGILRLMETYKQCSIIRLCLNYYYTLISNYLDGLKVDTLFRKDTLTPFYNAEIVASLNKLWTCERIEIVLNMTTYLNNNETADSDVKSLENIINNIDVQTQHVLSASS